MAFVVRRCRELYNAALQERIEAWQQCGASRSRGDAERPTARRQRGARQNTATSTRRSCRTCSRGWTEPSSAFFRRVKAGETAGLSALSGREPLQQLHLQAVRQRGDAGQRLPGPVQDRAHRRALVPPLGGHTQDRHDQPRGGRLVCLLLLRGCAGAAASRDWTGDGHRPGHRSLRHPVRWHAHLPSRLVSQSRARAENRPTAGISPQEGQQPQAQGGHAAGQGASEGATPAAGLSPQDSAGARSEPTTRSITRTCSPPTWSRITIWPSSITDAGWGAFLIILTLQGSMRRSQESSPSIPRTPRRRCSGCGVLVSQGLIRPLASLPGLRNQPASGPQRGQEHRAAWAEPSGRRGVSRVGEPRISRIYAGECQRPVRAATASTDQGTRSHQYPPRRHRRADRSGDRVDGAFAEDIEQTPPPTWWNSPRCVTCWRAPRKRMAAETPIDQRKRLLAPSPAYSTHWMWSA